MKKKLALSLILILGISLMSGCTWKEAPTDKRTSSVENNEQNTELSTEDTIDPITQEVNNSEIASGIMNFGRYKFELGDKLFKFEDAGFQCRENDYDTIVDPHTEKVLVLFLQIPQGNDATVYTEYVYLKGYNDSDEEKELRNCYLISISDDKTNKLLHLNVAKGIMSGITKDTFLAAYGSTDNISEENNSDIYNYTNEGRTCSVYVSKSNELVEKVLYTTTIEQLILDEQETIQNSEND